MGTDIAYDLEALKAGLDKIDRNIEIYEQAIRDARAEKERYIHMIAVLEAKKEKQDGRVTP